MSDVLFERAQDEQTRRILQQFQKAPDRNPFVKFGQVFPMKTHLVVDQIIRDEEMSKEK